MSLSKEELELNASLQKKKNSLRKELSEKGILEKKGKNDYDKYTYFSESQYKELFTKLFSSHGLELKFTELEYASSTSTSQKMPNVRTVKLQFTLIDIDTGYCEDTIITGEAFDKSDKAGYKAYTGALKYYLANSFLVATGDEVEKDTETPMINQAMYDKLKSYDTEVLKPYMIELKRKRLGDLTYQEAKELLEKLNYKEVKSENNQ